MKVEELVEELRQPQTRRGQGGEGEMERGSREQGKGGGVESHKNLDALLWPLALHIFYISN